MATHGQRLMQMLPTGQRLLNMCLTSNTTTSRSFFGPPGRWDPFSELVTTSRELDRSFAAMKTEMERFWHPPYFNKNMPIFSRFNQNVPRDGVHRISLDLNGCRPDDVNISVKDNVVTVEAKMEYKGDGSRLYQEWSQQYTLPDKVDTKNLKSILDKDGILKIEAPVSQLAGETQAESKIPIHNKS